MGLSKENPLGLAIGGAAVGFLAGILLPSTRVEDENLGEVSDQVIDRVKRTEQDALERGKRPVAGNPGGQGNRSPKRYRTGRETWPTSSRKPHETSPRPVAVPRANNGEPGWAGLSPVRPAHPTRPGPDDRRNERLM